MSWSGSGRLKMSEVKITSPCEKCDNKIRNVNEMHFGQGFIQLILECDHSVTIKMIEAREHSEQKRGEETKKVVNAAIAFMDQLNSFNSFSHPEVIKCAKELSDAVGTYLRSDLTSSEKETFKVFHRCEWCGEEIVQIPVSIKNYKSFSVVCVKCLQWKRENGTVIITEQRNVRPGPIILTNECKCKPGSKHISSFEMEGET
jgi:hypothetical protein